MLDNKPFRGLEFKMVLLIELCHISELEHEPLVQRNSFFTGLTATEFFFHTQGGREGLVGASNVSLEHFSQMLLRFYCWVLKTNHFFWTEKRESITFDSIVNLVLVFFQFLCDVKNSSDHEKLLAELPLPNNCACCCWSSFVFYCFVFCSHECETAFDFHGNSFIITICWYYST